MIRSLETGARGVIAQRIGLEVTGNNISNVNTPGYTRERANFRETAPLGTPKGLVGTGVNVASVQRVRSEFYDREIRDATSRNENFKSDATVVKRLEAILNEPTENGLDKFIKNFFDAFNQLAQRPESLDIRSTVVNAASSMANEFNNLGAKIDNLKVDLLRKGQDNAVVINRLTAEIASLNQQVANAISQGSPDGSEFADRRALAIEELSKYVNVSAFPVNNGMVNVQVGNSTLVTGGSAGRVQLRETVSPANERILTLQQVDNNNQPIFALNVQSGEMSSIMRSYNVTLNGTNSANAGFSIVQNLNQLASQLVSKVNAVSRTGFAPGDTGATPPNRNIFTPASPAIPITMNTIKLDNTATGLGTSLNPNLIPTSSAQGEIGNADVARRIAELVNDTTFVGGTTYNDFYNVTLVNTGNIGNDALAGEQTTEQSKAQLSALREGVNGVNLDEEAVNLIRFQRAFEASARVISTSDQILQTLVNLGR